MPKSNKRNTAIKPKRTVYLDHASGTPLERTVMALQIKIAKDNFANPSAIHSKGIQAKGILEESRKKVAKILGSATGEIIFTGGATESNNLAILGIISNDKSVPHIVTTNIEHASVLEVCKHLESLRKAEVTYIGVEPTGVVDPVKIKKALRYNTVLVSVMYANNEIGTVQPIKEIAKAIRTYNKVNSQKVLFHSDAAQAGNYLEMNVLRLGVDMLTLNGAKIYGSKGVGALYVKRGVPIKKVFFGGDQEEGLRPGTENLPQIAGFALALEIAEKIKSKEVKRLTNLREYFFGKLTGSSAFKNIGIIINGDKNNRLPNNVNITIPKIPSDLMIIELSQRGIYASEKSACKSRDKESSHVIEAIRPGEQNGSIRFSLGRSTNKDDIKYTLAALENIFDKLSKWYL
jgi:cysteine desulfurase